MAAIGVIGMEHPFRSGAVAQHGEIRIGIDNGRLQHLAREGNRSRHILHQQIDLEAAQRTPIGGRLIQGF